ncbi:hypothetical protein KAR91_63815 [Candidatus Pacearchaeota archaeon]|nr:hypothetical protein [Candidatus Pacearchaeota archaeon]
MNKCEKCANQILYTLGPDECGAGNVDGYCVKDHWHGLGPIDENDKGEYWDSCEDFEAVTQKEQADEMYNVAAKWFFGEYAYLNPVGVDK